MFLTDSCKSRNFSEYLMPSEIDEPGSHFFLIPWNSLIFPWFPNWFFLSFHQDIFVKRNIFILFICGLHLPLGQCLQKHQFVTDTLPKSKTSPNSHTKSYVHFYYFLSIYPLLENFPDWKIFPLTLAEKLLFFLDFPDWKRFSKFSLISLIGGNPVRKY